MTNILVLWQIPQTSARPLSPRMNEVKAGAGGCYAPKKWTMNGWSATELFCLLILLCFWRLICFHRWVIPSKFHSKSHRIHVCYICGNIYNQCTPNVNIYTSTMDPIGKATNKLPRIRQTHTHMSPKVTEHRDGDSPRHLSDLDSGLFAGGNLGGDQDLLIYIYMYIIYI